MIFYIKKFKNDKEGLKGKFKVLGQVGLGIIVGATLYFNPNDHADVADKMMMIYRDEKLRAQLIEKGKERVKNFSSEKSAALFWQSILKAVQNNSSI